MKWIPYRLVCIAIMVLSAGACYAQKDTTAIGKLRDTLKDRLEVNKVLQAKLDSLTKPAPCAACVKDITNPTQLFLVYAPFALLLLFTIIFIFWINKSNFTLEDALSISPSATQYAAAAKANAALAQNAVSNNQSPPAVPVVPAIPEPQPQRSTSRLLAFITGVTAILVSICLVSYYAYAMFAGCGNDAQLNALWKILMGLGIGIVPYGINVWNGNPKEQPAAKP